MASVLESWEREKWPISEFLEYLRGKNYTIISNVYQRKERVGRPFIVVNNDNYHIQNLTQDIITTPRGVEFVWCCLNVF